MIHWGELLGLSFLNEKATATNAELKPVAKKLDDIHREQQREREERRTAVLTPRQRAEEDRQRREQEAQYFETFILLRRCRETVTRV
jgi:hypothetical protein